MTNCVARYRKIFELSQQQLGELVGVSRNSISSIERGEYIPRLDLALRLADVFMVSVHSLFSIR